MSAFVIWALVAATGVFWGLRQFVRGPSAPAYTVPIGDSTVVRGDLTRLLGSPPAAPVAAAPAAPEISTRFRLVGVMAPRGAQGAGIAVISIDGKPARAFRVGAVLDSGLMLRAVALRTADLGTAKGDLSFTLELPPRVAAATGTLPAVSMTSPDGLAGGAPHQQGPGPGPGAMMMQQQPNVPPAPLPTFPPPSSDGEATPIDLPPPALDSNGQPLR